VRETQEEIEAHGEWNELNVLLRDFVAKLAKRRVLSRGAVRRVDGVKSARVEGPADTLRVPDVAHGTDPLVSNYKTSTTRIPYLGGALL
jgi:hypothetical protein